MEPKYHWVCVYLWWFTPGCLPDTGEKGKAERRRSGNLTYIFIFRPLIRSIGLHHGKIQSLKLLSYWGNLKTRKIPLTERGDLKSSWIYRTRRSTTKEALFLCTYWIWPSLSEIQFFFFFIACRVSNSGGVKFVPCFKNNIPKQTWWIRGDISF